MNSCPVAEVIEIVMLSMMASGLDDKKLSVSHNSPLAMSIASVKIIDHMFTENII